MIKRNRVLANDECRLGWLFYQCEREHFVLKATSEAVIHNGIVVKVGDELGAGDGDGPGDCFACALEAELDVGFEHCQEDV